MIIFFSHTKDLLSAVFSNSNYQLAVKARWQNSLCQRDYTIMWFSLGVGDMPSQVHYCLCNDIEFLPYLNMLISGKPLLSSHLLIHQGWPLNRCLTLNSAKIKSLTLCFLLLLTVISIYFFQENNAINNYNWKFLNLLGNRRLDKKWF